MSYVLHVWETPVPTSLADAAAVALDNGNDRLGQNPGFIVLAGRLRSRYPCMSVNSSDSVWSDYPLDGITDERAWKVGIRTDHAQVIPFLVEQANRLGLCAFDMQQGKAWAPGGTVFQMSEPTNLSVDGLQLNDSLTKFEVLAGLQRLMRKVFGPLGYVLEKEVIDGPGCQLALSEGWIRVSAALRDYAPTFEFSMFFQIRHHRAATIAATFRDFSPEARANAASALVQMKYFESKYDRVRVNSAQQFQFELEKIEVVLRDRVLPFLERCQTLEALERFVNPALPAPSRQAFDNYFADDITLAWMANNPDWERIGAARIAALHYRNLRARMDLERLMAYLRTVNPADLGSLPRSRSEGNAALIENYDGTQRKEFACFSVGQPGTPEFTDGNELYRTGLIIQTLKCDAPPVLLLHDLFCEELTHEQGRQDLRKFTMFGVTMALLTHGGADELQFVVESLPAEHMRQWRGEPSNMPEPVARHLSSVCAQRSRSVEYQAFAEAYQALGQALEKA